jgi:hypothetical protein
MYLSPLFLTILAGIIVALVVVVAALAVMLREALADAEYLRDLQRWEVADRARPIFPDYPRVPDHRR